MRRIPVHFVSSLHWRGAGASHPSYTGQALLAQAVEKAIKLA